MEDLIKIIPELGIAAFAMIVGALVVLKMQKVHTQERATEGEQRKEIHKSLMNYVESNNHQKTEMVEKHTEAMVVVGKNIEQNTKMVEKLVDKLDK